MTNQMFSFTLARDFVDSYAARPVDWGQPGVVTFTAGAGRWGQLEILTADQETA